MKKTIIFFLFVSLLSIVHSAFSQDLKTSDRNLIFVEATAEVTGQNDSAKISIAVLSEGRNLEQVSSENAGKTKAILTSIKNLDIVGLTLKSANYRVTPQKDYKVRPPKTKGYEVYNEIEVTMEGLGSSDLSRHVSKTVGKALMSGANTIRHIQFYIKNRETLKKKALTQATKKAIERAKILAEAAGVKLKNITSISTQPIHMPIRPHTFRAAELDADAATVEPPIEIGKSKVSVRISLAYEIEQ